jgi:hypothetical protein
MTMLATKQKASRVRNVIFRMRRIGLEILEEIREREDSVVFVYKGARGFGKTDF